MRVPRIGSIHTPLTVKNNFVKRCKKLTDPPITKDETNHRTNFGASVAYYLKKYATLPEEIQKNLSPKDAIDMFKEMEYVANGAIKEKSVGLGAESKVYKNPWLEGYYYLILNNPQDADLAEEIIYTKMNHMGDSVWCDNDDARIQLLGP